MRRLECCQGDDGPFGPGHYGDCPLFKPFDPGPMLNSAAKARLRNKDARAAMAVLITLTWSQPRSRREITDMAFEWADSMATSRERYTWQEGETTEHIREEPRDKEGGKPPSEML